MIRSDRSEIAVVLAMMAALLTGSKAIADEPKSPEPPPVAILIETPSDFDALIKRLTRPDYVIESGAGFERRQSASVVARPAPAVVESIEIRGEVIEDLAHLTIHLVASQASDGPIRLPIALDGLTVVESTEGDRIVPTLAIDGGWQIELIGRGRHPIRVTALARINPGLEGPRLEFGIPQVAATSVELNIAAPVSSATIGSKEPVATTAIEGGRSTRITAHLSPRKRFDLTWRVETEARSQGSPRLTAKGEIELTIDPGALQSRATWSVDCEQGTASNLEFRLDPREELLGLEVNGRAIAVEGVRDPASGSAIVPLGEILRPRSSARVVLQTRKLLLGGTSARLVYRGTPLVGAIVQSGVLAIARAGDLWVVGTADHGLRQLDPMSELPQGLRARPATILAYQFFTQPIELGLQVEPAPPRVRVEARSRIVANPRRATVETRLSYRVVSGPVFQVQVEVPESLDLESAGPADIVTSSQLLPEAATDQSRPTRILVLTLSTRARESGIFSLVLTGQQTIDASRSASIGLFRARQVSVRGTRLFIQAPSGVEAEPVDGGGFSIALATPSDWPDLRVSEPGETRLWLRNEGNPASITLRLAESPRVIRSETAILAHFDRRLVDVHQESVLHVRDGIVSSVDVEIPGSVGTSWTLEDPPVASRRRLADLPGGATRYRLNLVKEVSESLRFKFRLRLAIGSEPSFSPARVEIPVARIVEGSAAPPSYAISAEQGIKLDPVGPGWLRGDDAEPSPARIEGTTTPLRWSRSATTPGPAFLSMSVSPLASLPPLVASRLWLRTSEGPDGGLRTLAWYRLEPGSSSFAFQLPARSTLGRVWINGEVAAEVETTKENGYRLALPREPGTTPRHVGLEYDTPTASSLSQWNPPSLAAGGLVRQTLWTVRLPWNRATIGVPKGWTDENRWSWSTYIWMRRPLRGDDELARWIAGPTFARMPDGIDPLVPSGSHDYLFGRPGEPSSLPIWIASRAWLVAICSGSSLLLGLAIISWRVALSRLAVAAAALILVVAAFIDPSALFLAAESGSIGLALALLAFVTQRLVERPRSSPRALSFGDPATSSGSSRRLALPDVGSDESTIVRVSIGSTADHVRIERPAGDGQPDAIPENLQVITRTHPPGF